MTLRSYSLVPTLLLCLLQWHNGHNGGIQCFASASVDTVISHQQKDSEGVICEIDASNGEQVCQVTSESGPVTAVVDDSSTNDTTALEEEDPPTPDNDGGVNAGAAAMEDNCVDQHENCAFWASVDECTKNPGYMLSHCAMSCRSCINTTIAEETTLYGERQLINKNPDFMQTFQKMHDYMINTVFVNETFADVKDNCQNRNVSCAYWASIGECENNPKYMQVNCAPACTSCDLLDYEKRCPYDKNASKAWNKPGDLQLFFERLLDESYPQYRPTILSGPKSFTAQSSPILESDESSSSTPEKNDADAATWPAPAKIADNVVVDGPWVVLLENFLSDEECDRLIKLGYDRGYERSKDVGAKKFDGTFDSYENPKRTSTNAWCLDECYDDPIVQNVTARLEQLTGIPTNNSEYWQMLRYVETQEYMEHHDWIDFQLNRPEGVRILTVFFYLNTVEAGGGTRFTKLDITVPAVRGRVLIWPSTLDGDPDAKDARTHHQALPVERGIKYGANAWIHQRDYKSPHASGCT